MAIFLALLMAFLLLLVFGLGCMFALGFWVFGVVIKLAIIVWLFRAIFGRKR